MDRRRSKPSPTAVAATGPRRAAAAAALALAASLAAAGPARAQGDQPGAVVVAPAEVPPAPSPKPSAVPIDQNTARMIGARRLKIGVFAFDYGVTERFSFGTDPPEWVLKSVKSVLVPNLHFKGQLVHTAVVDVSAQLAGYYSNISTDTASGHVFVLPATLLVSTGLATPLWLHLEGAYNWARGFGSGDVARTNIDGTAVIRSAQVGAMLEYRLSRVVALLARGRYQFYASPITVEGNGTVDVYTTGRASLEVQPLIQHPAMGVAAVALTWKHVGVVAGAGYGHYFVPGINIPLPQTTVAPEFQLWALF
jgi:hypothetical protein